MNLPLQTRLFLGVVLLVGATLALGAFLTAREQRRWLVDAHAVRLERDARAVGTRLGATGSAELQGAAKGIAGLLGRRVTLLDATGRVLADSEVEASRIGVIESHADRPEVKAALGGGIGRDVRRSRTVWQEYLYVAVPARAPGFAVVRIAEPLAEIAELQRSQQAGVLIAVAFALAVALPLAHWVARIQSRRVGELEAVAVRIGAGDLEARAVERPADEIGRVGRAINSMSADLRARIEGLARERDERETILASMTDGVVLLDGRLCTLHANRSLAAILGAPLPPPPGMPFGQFARSPELEQLLGEAMAATQTVERELRLWALEQRVVRASATRFPGPDGGTVLLVIHDLSEIERLNRVRQDFVANVSHELKTPLTSVRGYAETLLEGGFDDLEHRESFARIIRDQARRLEALVDDLLSLAELERPDARLRRERFDLREAAERRMAEFRARAEAAGLRFEIEPGGPAWLDADRSRVDQVLANVLENALKYTERGAVTVALGTDEGCVWVEVRDTGPGIPAEHLDRIFERFYRVDAARSRERGGTGLGLAIVKHIVELHGGMVTVRSQVGGGSSFRLEFPAAAGSS